MRGTALIPSVRGAGGTSVKRDPHRNSRQEHATARQVSVHEKSVMNWNLGPVFLNKNK
ncbi:protein of unknown function [Trichlorobacter ammonificans]|uniref:Uncharacterized protein n=1 Tax=Trichlorobacter ammonificans TaxID=2916410 RepID=A0ABM9D9B4_9BACT|nr:protein of unknown function [Trichlorobacter ammonificans]